jgi:hypothetical protein
MTKRTRALPVVVLAVVALVLGTFGTATAAGLTVKQVKKIATKVVKKQAKHLTVANATNATNAANLGGKAPSAYLNTATTYSVNVAAPVNQVLQTIPLTAGSTYKVDFSALLLQAAPGNVGCAIVIVNSVPTITGVVAAEEHQSGTEAAMSGGGIVTVPAGQKVLLDCFASSTFTTSPLAPIQVAVTPLDSATVGGGLAPFPRADALRGSGSDLLH